MRRLVVVLCLIFSSACAVLAGDDRAAPMPLETAMAFLAAYNAHDVEALLALSAEDITWLMVEGDRVEVVTRGRSALGDALRTYFDDYPGTRSDIDASLSNGAYVVTRERAVWLDGEQERSQVALAIYEICGRLICRVWYYPAVY